MSDADHETIGLHAQLACVWEVTARKPGNVHRYADFDDLSYLDFLTSAAAVAPALAASPDQRVGATVLEGVRRTRRVVATNSNLGIVATGAAALRDARGAFGLCKRVWRAYSPSLTWKIHGWFMRRSAWQNLAGWGKSRNRMLRMNQPCL